MRRNFPLAGFLLAFTCTALAAGRGGFPGGGQAESRGGASAGSAGSGGFRPSGGGGGGGGGEFHHSEPSGGGGGAPVSHPPAQVFQRPVVESPRVVQPEPGRASILPSQTGRNRVESPRVLPQNPGPAVQGQVPIPTQRAEENDFLGMRGEHSENRRENPNRPNPAVNPGIVNRPVQTSPAVRGPVVSGGRVVLANPPGRPERPVRPPLPDRWRNVSNNFNSQYNHWQQTSAAGLVSFQSNRAERWNQIQQAGNDRNWPKRLHSPAFQSWRGNVWNFRKDRAEEVWAATRDVHEHLFNDHWWNTCAWRRNTWSSADISPWWWWNTASWADTTAFFGSTIGADPIPYDPGTNAFYEDDSFYVDGQNDGNATDARDQAAELAGPPVDEAPVPGPAADGQTQEWLSLGAWALTQQEQGDPVMFFQISVNKDGIVAGGYKNALTGDEQPIVGRLDRRTQRVAWHINSSPQTVFETGLSDLNYDVASAFVHFGQAQTQTWLLVRLPSPADPPTTVSAPK